MTLRARIGSVTSEAPSINSYALWPVDCDVLPPFTAGAHVDLILGNGLVRSYSLTNSQDERHRYVIAVQQDRNSRGGSKWIHENVRVGDVITLDGPRNNFGLNEGAQKSLLIAGGIGITPFLSMIERLDALKRDWELIYCARDRARAAFFSALEARAFVRVNLDEEPGGTALDIATIVRSASEDTHLYCCGPVPMLEAFESATKDVARDRVHLEYFSAKEAPSREREFTVVLHRSGRELSVPAGKTILEVLREHGIEAAYSCTEGMCGTCETAVIGGIPDHRDAVLTEMERASNKTIMICCSGSKTEKLVLDI